MKITEQETSHVADLARLSLSEEELSVMTAQLNTILSYVAKLDELDTEQVTPTTHALAIVNALRDDVVKPSLERQEALGNAPLQNGEAFVVPRII